MYAIYTAVSRYGVISLVPAPATTFSLPKGSENVVAGAGTRPWRHIIFQDTFKFNHFFCLCIFARFETKDLLGTRRLFPHCPINMLKTRFVYENNDALLEISSAHSFGAGTNVSCYIRIKELTSDFGISPGDLKIDKKYSTLHSQLLYLV